VFFFSFSYIQSRSQLYAANTSSSFAFLQMVLVDGIPLSSCTVYRYFVPFF